jgi:hypothetical protein
MLISLKQWARAESGSLSWETKKAGEKEKEEGEKDEGEILVSVTCSR